MTKRLVVELTEGQRDFLVRLAKLSLDPDQKFYELEREKARACIRALVFDRETDPRGALVITFKNGDKYTLYHSWHHISFEREGDTFRLVLGGYKVEYPEDIQSITVINTLEDA